MLPDYHQYGIDLECKTKEGMANQTIRVNNSIDNMDLDRGNKQSANRLQTQSY